jgi:hypothetical protein
MVVLLEGRTPVGPRVRTNIAQSNQRLLLQQIDISEEARTLDAAYREK